MSSESHPTKKHLGLRVRLEARRRGVAGADILTATIADGSFWMYNGEPIVELDCPDGGTLSYFRRECRILEVLPLDAPA